VREKERVVIDTDLLKDSVDVERVVSHYLPGGLKRMGPDAIGLCPFHAEKTPSFKVHIRRRTGLPAWKCFGCGAAGDVIKFVQMMEGCSFKDAVDILTSQFSGDSRAVQSSASVMKQRAASEWYDRQIEGIKCLIDCYDSAMMKLSRSIRANPESAEVLTDAYFSMQRDVVVLAGLGHLHGELHLQDMELRDDGGLLKEALQFGLNGYAVAACFESQMGFIPPIKECAGRLRAAPLAVRLATREADSGFVNADYPDRLSGICESLHDLEDMDKVLAELQATRQTWEAAVKKVLGASGGRVNKRATEGYRQSNQGRGKPRREHQQQPAT
jgi:hypothetical protein